MRSFELNSKLQFFWPDFSVDLIRVGPNEDGGYILPYEMLPRIKNVISFGVNVDWRFEQELNDKFRIPVSLFDSSSVLRLLILFLLRGVARSLFIRTNLKELRTRFERLYNYFIFFQRANVRLEKLFINKKTAENIFINCCKNTLLKCDIEGSEYGIFDLIVLHKDKFDLIIMEVHDIESNLDKLEAFINELQKDFATIHLHMNNYYPPSINRIPYIMEVTIARRNCITKKGGSPQYLPIHGLDYPNVKNKLEFRMVSPC